MLFVDHIDLHEFASILQQENLVSHSWMGDGASWMHRHDKS